MLPYRDSRLTYIALAVFFVLLVGYAGFEAQGILFGPSITVNSRITEMHDPFIIIKGKADRIASLLMNGKSISVTETGVFEQPYLLAEGYNLIVLEARDKYGHRARKELEIVYNPDQSGIVAGTSTTTPTGSASSTRAVAPR